MTTRLIAFFSMLLMLGFSAPSQHAAAQINEEQLMSWALSDGTIVDPGVSVLTEQGSITTGLVIEAKAKALDEAPINSGLFRAELTVFSPNEDMPGIQAGTYALQGKWYVSLTSSLKLDKKDASRKHLSGPIHVVLPSDPTLATAAVDTPLILPMQLYKSVWYQGDGGFQGDTLFNGTLAFTVRTVTVDFTEVTQ